MLLGDCRERMFHVKFDTKAFVLTGSLCSYGVSHRQGMASGTEQKYAGVKKGATSDAVNMHTSDFA